MFSKIDKNDAVPAWIGAPYPQNIGPYGEYWMERLALRPVHIVGGLWVLQAVVDADGDRDWYGLPIEYRDKVTAQELRRTKWKTMEAALEAAKRIEHRYTRRRWKSWHQMVAEYERRHHAILSSAP